MIAMIIIPNGTENKTQSIETTNETSGRISYKISPEKTLIHATCSIAMFDCHMEVGICYGINYLDYSYVFWHHFIRFVQKKR